jgi:hypothetical protein
VKREELSFETIIFGNILLMPLKIKCQEEKYQPIGMRSLLKNHLAIPPIRSDKHVILSRHSEQTSSRRAVADDDETKQNSQETRIPPLPVI